MASVTFPTEFGGDGNTYTDDTDPQTGLANDGHRTRFVPSLAGAVAMAAYARQMADETHDDRQAVQQDRTAAQTARAQAQSARDAAELSASSAQTAASNADASAQQASAMYPTVDAGMADTGEGQYFKVPEAGYIQLYRNLDGKARPILRLASQEAVASLAQQPDPLLTSLLF